MSLISETPSPLYERDYWWQKTCRWTGLEECPKPAQLKLVRLIEKIRKDQKKHKLNILVVGKLGVGKSSLIKSIVGQDFLEKGAKVFAGRKEIDLLRTLSVKEMLQHNPQADLWNNEKFEFAFVSAKYGFTLKFFYAPWLIDASDMEYRFMEPLTRYPSEKHIDVLLYVDRADVYTVPDIDLMTVMLITKLFGESVWKKALIVLTHSDAVDKFKDEDFTKKRKEQLLSWMRAGGWIDEHLLQSLVKEAVLVDNTKIYNTGEEICDDDNLLFLIQKIFYIAMDSEIPDVSLKPLYKWENLEDLHREILECCKAVYFEMTPKGKRQRSFPTSSDADAWDPSYASRSLVEFLNKLRKDRPNFSILVMGKCGVGKSSIINRIIGMNVIPISNFEGERDVFVWSGKIGHSTLRIMETPGFLHFRYAHPNFYKAVKWYQRHFGIDALIYVDRLDECKWDLSRALTIIHIAKVFGPKIMSRILIVLTHCESISGEQEPIATKLSTDIKYEILNAASPTSEVSKRLFKFAEVQTIVVENGGKRGKNGMDQCGWLTDLLEKLFASRIDVSLWDDWNPRLPKRDYLEGASDDLFDLRTLPRESVFEEHNNNKKSRADLPDKAQEVS